VTREDFKKELDKLTSFYMLSGDDDEGEKGIVNRIYDSVDVTLIRALEDIVLLFRLNKTKDDKEDVKKEEVLNFISEVVDSVLASIDSKIVGVVNKALKTKDDAEEVMSKNKQES